MTELDVAVIFPHGEPGLGGSERINYKIADILAEEGHNITVFTMEDRDKEEIEDLLGLKYSGFDIKEIESSWIFEVLKQTNRLTLLTLVAKFSIFSDLIEELDSEFDILFFTGSMHVRKNLSLSSPTLTYHHKNPKLLEEVEMKNFLYRAIINGISELKLVSSDRDLFNSNFIKNKSDIEGETVYPYVSEEIIFNEDNKSGIISLGRISREKNLELAVELSNKTGEKLNIVGIVQDKSYLEELKELSENTSFFTDVSEEKKSNYWRTASLDSLVVEKLLV